MQFPQREHKSTGNKFVKLTDKPIKGVFAGEPRLFLSHYLGAGKGSDECAGDSCQRCEEGNRPTERFRVNFITYENGEPVAKILESSGPTYDSLKQLHEAGYDLSSNLIQLSKVGTGTQTRVIVIPVPQGALSPAQVEGISKSPLNSLLPPKVKSKDPLDNFESFDAE